jgi:hypothetical protein
MRQPTPCHTREGRELKVVNTGGESRRKQGYDGQQKQKEKKTKDTAKPDEQHIPCQLISV